jgi:hypothetical protein
MTKFKNPIFSLLLVSIFFTSCNGQTKTEQPNKTVGEQQSFTSKNVKLTKTQGTTEHQNVHCSLQDKDGNLWFGTTGEGVYDARSDAYTDMATFKNDVLTYTGAPDLQNSRNAVPIGINNATAGDLILNRYTDNNVARHVQVVSSPVNEIGIMGIVQGNSGVMNKVPGASRVFGAGNPASLFYTGQHIEKAIYIPAADFYKNYSTGSTYSKYSQVQNIDIRRWNFKRF